MRHSRATLSIMAILGFFAACSAAPRQNGSSSDGGGGSGGASSASSSSSGGAGGLDVTVGSGGSTGCDIACSGDLHSVIDCNGNVLSTCAGTDACDLTTLKCVNACAAAVNNKQSVGCEYYATFMDNIFQSVCFAVFVANTWNTPAHIQVEYQGAQLPVGSFAYIPQGQGPNLGYQPYDPATGIPPGEVAILFLSGPQGSQPQIPNIYCPKSSAIPSGVLVYGTGIGSSFHVTSDVPVVSYQINPYAGGGSEVTGASLLLPTSAWDTNYIAASAYAWSPGSVSPSMNIVAAQDNTSVTLVPVKPVVGGKGVPAGPENVPLTFTLNKGQHAQLTQNDELSGSVIQTDKPVGLMAGHPCMYVPVNVTACDHGEQMVPPVRALGSEYVAVMHKPRTNEPSLWRMIGAVDGTTLTYSSAVGGPVTLAQGEVVEFVTATPFVVESQDKDHPFILFNLMVGGAFQAGLAGYGDADSVISVPPEQYMSTYVFFADPTYPETSLVLVRSKAKSDGKFKDVELDCAGAVGGWTPVGDYEWTRVDLITGDFQPVGNCSTGRHEIKSDAPFGLWIWGWGTPKTTTQTAWVSYGYPGGMNVQPINQVVVPPVPK